MHKPIVVYLLLGSNLGDRLYNLELAYLGLGSVEGLEVLAKSAVFESSAFEMSENSPPFLNQALEISCSLTALELLDSLEAIERQLGRENKEEKLSREIDIDILLYGKKIIDTKRLTTPHAKLTRRAFALAPLVDLRPELVDPRSGELYATYLNDLFRSSVSPYTNYA